MKKFSNLGITAIVTGDKLKIEIPITGLISGFNRSPENTMPEITVRRGKRKEFAEFVAQKLIDGSNQETGDSLAGEMFDKAFEDVFEGNDFNDDIFKYPDDEEEE